MQQVGVSLQQVRENSSLAEVSFIKKNYEFKKIKEREHEPMFKMLLGCAFAEISAFAGIKNEISDENKRDILKMILTVYNDLTLEEIYKAFELERYFAYEDKTEHFQLFNAVYISTVLKKYKNWRQNLKIQHNISKGNTTAIEPSQITEKKQQQIRNEFIQHLYREIKEHGYTFDARLIYKELEEKGKIIIGNSKKTELYNKQYDKILFSLKAKALKGATSEIKDLIHSMVKAQEEGKWVKQVADECMAIMVCEYLKDYMENINEFKQAIQ